MKKIISILAAISILCTSLPMNIFAYSDNMSDKVQYDNIQPEDDTEEKPQFADNRVIVKVKNSVSLQSLEESKNDDTFLGIDVTNTKVLSTIDNVSLMSEDGSENNVENGTIMLLTLDESGEDKVLSAIEELEKNPQVLYAEPDYIFEAQKIPNDEYYDQLYAMDKISAPEAWEKTTGSKDVVVGVLDTGIDYTHDDLKGNMWINENEIPDNGIDDDNNGYIDDYYGWNFVDNSPDVMDEYYHGTHVASTIGAVGNNEIGITGINWNVRLMAIKVLGDDGLGTASSIVEGIEYAGQMGVYITNNSYGVSGNYTQAEKDVIDKYSDRLFVAAAGNDEKNNNEIPVYPSSYDCDNIISVAASNINDER